MQEIERDQLTHIQSRILTFIKEHGHTRRAKIVHNLNIPRSTAYDNLEKLERWGYVRRVKNHNGKQGRPAV
jgi:predicted ArsR family transcriptional regulator